MSDVIDMCRSGQIIFFGPRTAVAGFTRRDRLELERWAGQGRRSMTCYDDNGPYAMLYEGVVPWALWGVMRQDDELKLWDCVTFADIGRFRTMHDALAALPSTENAPWTPLANVVAFAPANRSVWAPR